MEILNFALELFYGTVCCWFIFGILTSIIGFILDLFFLTWDGTKLEKFNYCIKQNLFSWEAIFIVFLGPIGLFSLFHLIVEIYHIAKIQNKNNRED